MDIYLIVTRSITQAQQMQRVLLRAGLSSQIIRGHRAIMQGGCGYTVQVAGWDAAAAAEALRQAQLRPERIYRYQNGLYQEVVL